MTGNGGTVALAALALSLGVEDRELAAFVAILGERPIPTTAAGVVREAREAVAELRGDG